MPPTADPQRFLPLKPDELLILMALAAGPLHGYGLMRDVEARSDGQVILQTGALYRTMRRLLTHGLIEECPQPDHVDSRDDRRLYYAPTALGRLVLEADVNRMARLVRAARQAAGGRRSRLV